MLYTNGAKLTNISNLMIENVVIYCNKALNISTKNNTKIFPPPPWQQNPSFKRIHLQSTSYTVANSSCISQSVFFNWDRIDSRSEPMSTAFAFIILTQFRSEWYRFCQLKFQFACREELGIRFICELLKFCYRYDNTYTLII